MGIRCRLLRALTVDEQGAGSSYGADSTFFHAMFQGRSAEVNCQPGFTEFQRVARTRRVALDRAIAQSELVDEATLYSAHGQGFGVRGSLLGKPQQFVGLQYSYRGYISTSASLDWAKAFLAPREFRCSRPTLLEFHLPAGFKVLDMHRVNQSGEFEYLLARDLAFTIIDASEQKIEHINDMVLWLTLVPFQADEK